MKKEKHLVIGHILTHVYVRSCLWKGLKMESIIIMPVEKIFYKDENIQNITWFVLMNNYYVAVCRNAIIEIAISPKLSNNVHFLR